MFPSKQQPSSSAYRLVRGRGCCGCYWTPPLPSVSTAKQKGTKNKKSTRHKRIITNTRPRPTAVQQGVLQVTTAATLFLLPRSHSQPCSLRLAVAYIHASMTASLPLFPYIVTATATLPRVDRVRLLSYIATFSFARPVSPDIPPFSHYSPQPVKRDRGSCVPFLPCVRACTPKKRKR